MQQTATSHTLADAGGGMLVDGSVRTKRRTFMDADIGDDMAPPRFMDRSQLPLSSADTLWPAATADAAIPHTVMRKVVAALMLAGALPMMSSVAISETAARSSTIAAMQQLMSSVAPSLVAEAFSRLLQQPAYTTQDSAEIAAALLVMLRFNVVNIRLLQAPHTLRTPLHWAAYGGYTAAADMCIANGVDIDALDAYGHSPLDFANASLARASGTGISMSAWLEARGARRSDRSVEMAAI